MKSIGVSYNFSKFFKINIQDECDCYAHVNEYEESENKFSGKVITYGILKDNEKENVDEKIKEKSKEEVEKYFKDNYDMKYEGGFSFELPNLDELNCESLLKSELFEVELDGDIKNKVEYTFSLNGKSKLKFFFRNEDFDCDLICTDVTYLTNGEYYKGDMKNFDRKGHGLYFNKKGLGIEGNYIDDYTIDGKVVIYNKKKEIIATKEYNKKKIKNLIIKFQI